MLKYPHYKNFVATRAVMLIALLYLLPVFTHAQEKQPPPLANKGLVDLRNVDIDNQNVSLNGQWQLYWRQLLTPAQADTSTGFTYTPFPASWNKSGLPPIGYATYRLTVFCPTATANSPYLYRMYIQPTPYM